jgi:hypothetical protein
LFWYRGNVRLYYLMNTEQTKQLVSIELESARLWATFLIPSIALDMTLFVTDKFFAGNPLARNLFGALILIWVLFVVYKRNEHIINAARHIENLK